MKKNTLISLALLSMLAAPAALAIPADPQPKKVRQPDGTYITVLMRGDEHAHMLLADDGTPLFFNTRSRAFEYATLKNNTITGSGMMARNAKDRDAKAKAFVSEMDTKAISR